MTVPNAKILETTVTPNARGSVVQLQISDAPLDAEAWAIRLTLSVQIPAYRLPLVAHVEREAINIADDVLAALLRNMAEEIQAGRHNLRPTLKD